MRRQEKKLDKGKRKAREDEDEDEEECVRPSTTVGALNAIKNEHKSMFSIWGRRLTSPTKGGNVSKQKAASRAATSASPQSPTDIPLMPSPGPSRYHGSDQAYPAESSADPQFAPQAGEASAAAAHTTAPSGRGQHRSRGSLHRTLNPLRLLSLPPTAPPAGRRSSAHDTSAPALTSSSGAFPGSSRAPSQTPSPGYWSQPDRPMVHGRSRAGSASRPPPSSRPPYMQSVPEQTGVRPTQRQSSPPSGPGPLMTQFQAMGPNFHEGMAGYDPSHMGAAPSHNYSAGPPELYGQGDSFMPLYSVQHGSPAFLGEGMGPGPRSRSMSYSTGSAPGGSNRMYAPPAQSQLSPTRARRPGPYPTADERSHMRPGPSLDIPAHHGAQLMQDSSLSTQSYPPTSASTTGIGGPGSMYHTQSFSQPALPQMSPSDFNHWDPGLLQPLPPSSTLSSVPLPPDTPSTVDYEGTPRSFFDFPLPPDMAGPSFSGSYGHGASFDAPAAPMSADHTANAMNAFQEGDTVVPWLPHSTLDLPQFEPPPAGTLNMYGVHATASQGLPSFPYPGSGGMMSAGSEPWAYQAGPNVLAGGASSLGGNLPAPHQPQSQPQPRQGHNDGRPSVATPELHNILFRGRQMPWGLPPPRSPDEPGPEWEKLSWGEVVDVTRVVRE